MTFAEMTRQKIRATHFFVERNKDAPPHRPDLFYRAVHWEKVSRGVRVKTFYSVDRDAALAKAERYDRTRRELLETWKARRQAA